MNLNKYISVIQKICTIILTTGGMVFFVILFLSFTEYPFWAYYKLGTKNSAISETPDYIILMGSSGMPSPDGLIRSYYAANAAKLYAEANIIVALPADTFEVNNNYKIICNELVLHGVDSSRIEFESEGTSTYTQARNISRKFQNEKDTLNLIIITSPEHLYRSLLTFRKFGFHQVGGKASFEKNLTDELLTLKDADPDKTILTLSLRYNMWNYLKYEIIVLREYCALSYYKLKGWL